MSDDLRRAIDEIVETWRDDAWDYQRRGRPELRDMIRAGMRLVSGSGRLSVRSVSGSVGRRWR